MKYQKQSFLPFKEQNKQAIIKNSDNYNQDQSDISNPNESDISNPNESNNQNQDET